jgi:hypothetical protein
MNPEITEARHLDPALRMTGRASHLVGFAAALEVARNVAQVMISDPTMDVLTVAREAVEQRIREWRTYGSSWRDADLVAVSEALAVGWAK